MRGFKSVRQELFEIYCESVNKKQDGYYVHNIILYIGILELEIHKNEAIKHLKDSYNVVFDQQKIDNACCGLFKYEDALHDKRNQKNSILYCGLFQGNTVAFYVGD